MFGNNRIVGKSHFSNADDKLLVTSMFMTLQGEGPYRGEPSFFVRLAMCNLACGFCDTYFDSGNWLTVDEVGASVDTKIEEYFKQSTPKWASYRPEMYKSLTAGQTWPQLMTNMDKEFGTELTFDDLYNMDEGGTKLCISAKKRDMVFVVTGGEPTLQKNLYHLLEWAETRFRATQIESNGLLPPPVPKSTTVVISPKCLEKDGKAIRYLNPHQAALDRADCLKFVMESNESIETTVVSGNKYTGRKTTKETPYSTIPDWAFEWREKTGKPIFVSPMNIYAQEPQKSKQLRASKSDITLEERSTVDEVISFWTPGLLDMEANQRNHEYTAKYAINNGLIFNVQQHLLAGVA